MCVICVNMCACEFLGIAGITNPKQLKADYDHIRYIIQNDHCYTPYTYLDSLPSDHPDHLDAKASDSKSKANTKSAITNVLTKKIGRIGQTSKSVNGLDKDSQESNTRKRSVEDATSSAENNPDRTSDEEEAESETDYSDFSVSESDNDRDSDLDFSVNDCHSRRTRKIKKRKIRAKKMAAKKRRHSTIDNCTGSDDGLTPTRKKATKVPKKSLNTSVKTPNANVTPTISNVKSPVAQSTPRITKASIAAATATKDTSITLTPTSHSLDDSTKLTLGKKKLNESNPATNTTPIITTPIITPTVDPKINKPTILIRQKVEKKVNPESNNALLSDMSSLFSSPDIIKKVKNAAMEQQNIALTSSIVTIVPKPIVISSTTIVTPKIEVNKSYAAVNKLRSPTVKLESEQDKQLDLIDSLVQEELNKTDIKSISQPVSTKIENNTLELPADIPNIVKMLETPEPVMSTTDLSNVSSTSVNTSSMQHTYSTTPSNNDTSQMLPDDLLESFVNSDDCLTDDLMKHVAKLVEDKNLQEVIDQQVLGVTQILQPSTSNLPIVQKQTTTAPIQPIQKPTVITILNPVLKTPDDKLTLAQPKIMTAVPVTMATPGSSKEPIKVKRSDGRIITLPPIEAPTTRGAKRRAEIVTTPRSDQQLKPRIITVVVQTDTNTTPKSTTTTSQAVLDKLNLMHPQNSSMKAKSISARERRTSVAVKRVSVDSKPKRSLSISNPPPKDDDFDDEEDGSDGSYNSEDDPHR